MKLCLLLFSTCLLSSVVFSQRYKTEKQPEWVKMIDIPTKSIVKKYDVSLGYYLALANYQINLEQNAFYYRDVINVTSYSGITQASQLSVAYDTSYQQLNIHHLYIWRNGEKINRTSELNFKMLTNEYNLDNGIYMGLITAYCNLNDIRKDDLIDFAYTLVGKNPIFKNEKYLFLPLEMNNPIDLYSIRILYSKDKDYAYRCVGQDTSAVVERSVMGNYQQLEINLSNVKAITLEENIPSSTIPYGYFLLSSFKTWKEVNRWAQDVFVLQSEPDLNMVFKEIFRGGETMDEKINKVINYVQDDIRYMGIEAGIGSIKPFPPDQVVKQRFGDCKDKSLLLVSLLKKIGIRDAYPALVNTSLKKNIDSFYPNNEIFNHCVVSFTIGDTTYWIDPTLTQQGGDYRTMGIFNFEKALIVGLPSDTLSAMNIQKIVSSVHFIDEYRIKSFTDPALLDLQSIRSGLDADMRRIMLEQHSMDEHSKLITDDLKHYYPTVTKIDSVSLHDDIHHNILSSTYRYEIDGFWKDGDKLPSKKLAGYWLFKFEPHSLYPDFNPITCVKRHFDYALDFPLNIKYTVILHFPKDILVRDRFLKRDNVGFYFDKKIEQLSSNSLQVIYNYRTKSSAIKASDYEKICEEKNKIAELLPILVYFNK